MAEDENGLGARQEIERARRDLVVARATDAVTLWMGLQNEPTLVVRYARELQVSAAALRRAFERKWVFEPLDIDVLAVDLLLRDVLPGQRLRELDPDDSDEEERPGESAYAAILRFVPEHLVPFARFGDLSDQQSADAFVRSIIERIETAARELENGWAKRSAELDLFGSNDVFEALLQLPEVQQFVNVGAADIDALILLDFANYFLSVSPNERNTRGAEEAKQLRQAYDEVVMELEVGVNRLIELARTIRERVDYLSDWQAPEY